jgi:hypothetical protein
VNRGLAKCGLVIFNSSFSVLEAATLRRMQSSDADSLKDVTVSYT